MTSTAYNQIYGAKKNNVKKSKFYKSFQRNKHFPNVLTTTDKATHAKTRKVLNSVFSAETVQSAESFIIKHVDRWCDIVGEGSTDWTEPKNVSAQIDFMTFDIMGDLAFGVDFKTKEAEENPMKAIPETIHGFLKGLNTVITPPCH
jgi:cytochrome P450